MRTHDDLHRRRFLGTSTAAGLGLALGASTRAAGRGERADDKRTYRIGIIGSTGRGDYGHSLDTAWQAFPSCRIVAVADDNEAGRARARRRLSVQDTYSDYREMLDKAKPDIACICPRWLDQHRDMAVAAAERGIHVFMEKPFCRTLEEADEIVAACREHGTRLALALLTHYSPRLDTVRKLIREGAIGEVLEYRARGKEDRRGGGEDLWVLGVHVLDLVRCLGGQPEWCFAEVTEGGERVARRHVRDGNEGIGPLAGDTIHAMYGMPGSPAAYFASRRDAKGDPWRFALRIYGSRGILEIQEGTLAPVKYLPDPSWCPARSGARWKNVSTAGIDRPEPLTAPEYQARHHLAIRDLLEAIEQDREPLCGPEDARQVTEMIVAVFESHRLGRPVKLPLETRVNPLTLLE